MHIDLNADLGESFGRWRLGDDAALLDLVTSANVACGFHAGDPATILGTVAAAAARGVTIGAHVAYPDLAGFGRRFMDMAPSDLTAAVIYQIGALDGLCRAAGTRVRYAKPHGALYNTVVHHEPQARAIVSAIASYDAALPILGLPGSALLAAAEAAGLPSVRESFVDRGYRADGTLVPRGEPDALIDDPGATAKRAVLLATRGEVDTASGGRIRLSADSLCVHGDSPSAARMARAVRDGLEAAGVVVRAFAWPGG